MHTITVTLTHTLMHTHTHTHTHRMVEHYVASVFINYEWVKLKTRNFFERLRLQNHFMTLYK